MYFFCKYFGLLKDLVGKAILLPQCICMLFQKENKKKC